MTWDSLLVRTINGCGMLKITPISPTMSADPSIDKNWKTHMSLVNNIKNVLSCNRHGRISPATSFPSLFMRWGEGRLFFSFLFFFLGGMGMIIRELTAVFVLLLYGNFYFFLFFYFFMLNLMPVQCWYLRWNSSTSYGNNSQLIIEPFVNFPLQVVVGSV